MSFSIIPLMHCAALGKKPFYGEQCFEILDTTLVD